MWPSNARPHSPRRRKALESSTFCSVPPQDHLAKLLPPGTWKCPPATSWVPGPSMYPPKVCGNTCPSLVTPRCQLYNQGQKTCRRQTDSRSSYEGKKGEYYLEHLSTPFPDRGLISSFRMLWKAAPLFCPSLPKSEKLRAFLILKDSERNEASWSTVPVYTECQSCARDRIKGLYSTPQSNLPSPLGPSRDQNLRNLPAFFNF